jgi:AraC family transcriptional regulator
VKKTPRSLKPIDRRFPYGWPMPATPGTPKESDALRAPDTQTSSFGTVIHRVEVPGVRAAEASYPRARSLPLHAHEFPFLTYVISGEYAEIAGTSTRECARGTVVFHPSPEAHENRVGSADVRCFNVELTDDYWTEVIDRANRGGRLRSIAFRGDAEWPAFNLWREFHRQDAATPLTIEESLLALISALSEESDRLEARGGRWIERAAELVAAQLVPSPRLRDVARDVGVHPMHLAKVFRLHYGCSIGEFIRRRRVAWACSQLARDAGTITTIAIQAGFADHAHFTRTFRRITGCTPTWYRQRLRVSAFFTRTAT